MQKIKYIIKPRLFEVIQTGYPDLCVTFASSKSIKTCLSDHVKLQCYISLHSFMNFLQTQTISRLLFCTIPLLVSFFQLLFKLSLCHHEAFNDPQHIAVKKSQQGNFNITVISYFQFKLVWLESSNQFGKMTCISMKLFVLLQWWLVVLNMAKVSYNQVSVCTSNLK